MSRLTAALAAIAALVAIGAPAAADAARRAPDTHGRYIVLYERSVSSVNTETNARERRDGFRVRFRYRHAVKGFSARLDRRQLRRLRSDAEVASVTPDYPVHALGSVGLASGEPTPPTGVRRIGAATGTTARQASSVNVAVIDTGVDLRHPDLNAVNGANCVDPGATAQDDNGHGTHVAGTIGARNNGSGVVGVAPGTKVYSVKVLDDTGSGSESSVICGIDWVTAHAASENIKVANMSLGGLGYRLDSCPSTADPEHKAICDSTAAGVTYAVAAGNEGWDYDYALVPDVPAAYPEALAVTAMSDSDGAAGGTGGAGTCPDGEADDRYVSWSNYAATAAGQAHTIAGPGVCIRSTWLGGGYDTISGTSMATPHLAGATALCYGEAGAAGPCAGKTPAQVIQLMRQNAANLTASYPVFGYTGDPIHSPIAGRYYGYLDWSGNPGSIAAPPVTTVTAKPAAVAVLTGSLRNGNAASLAAYDSNWYRVNSTTTGTRTAAWFAGFSGVPSTLKNIRLTYAGANTRNCTQTVAIYDFTASTWVTLNTRTVGTTPVTLSNLSPGGTPSRYVNSSGALAMRVQCTTTAGSFYSSANQLQLKYDR